MSGVRAYLEQLMEEPLKGRVRTLKRVKNGVVKHGHYAAPGTGPKGESCGTCAYLARNELGKTYFKCGRTAWTHGSATDIAKRDDACLGWERRP